MISESKLDNTIPFNRFHFAGFKQYRQDQNQFGGCFVLFVNENIPYRSFYDHPKFPDLELTAFELHQSKQKWLFLGLYKPPFQNDVKFLTILIGKNCVLLNSVEEWLLGSF